MRRLLRALRRFRSNFLIFASLVGLMPMMMNTASAADAIVLNAEEQVIADDAERFLLSTFLQNVENPATRSQALDNSLQRALTEMSAELQSEGLVAESCALQPEGQSNPECQGLSSLQNNCSNTDGGFANLNLGDHEPLSRKLACVYDTIESRIGADRARSMRLADVRTFNFGLPVVAQPRGDRRNSDTWDKLEYRRHFVPTIEASAYWGAYLYCRKAAEGQPIVRSFCKKIAGKVAEVIAIRFAPLMSDRIYEAAVAR